jgi:hypothetical protein
VECGVSEARDRISTALDDKLTEKQLQVLLDEVLALTKQGRGWCPKCGKHVMVEVSDSKAVVAAISELLTQAEGRPRQQEGTAEAGITFVRKVVYGGEPDVVEEAS